MSAENAGISNILSPSCERSSLFISAILQNNKDFRISYFLICGNIPQFFNKNSTPHNLFIWFASVNLSLSYFDVFLNFMVIKFLAGITLLCIRLSNNHLYAFLCEYHRVSQGKWILDSPLLTNAFSLSDCLNSPIMVKYYVIGAFFVLEPVGWWYGCCKRRAINSVSYHYLHFYGFLRVKSIVYLFYA